MTYYAGLVRGLQAETDSALPARRRNSDTFYRRHGKRITDLALLLPVLPILFLVILVLAAMIAMDGGRPFYSQMRVGRGGRLFRLWKLRTMVHDADARLRAHLDSDPDAALEWKHTQKLRDDPRITRAGRFLRRSSLDELPQFFNVLRGEMSIVGPRPMLPEQRSMYSSADYYEVAPGVTGPWQVSDRNGSTFAARATFDSEYNRTLSLRQDLHLIGRTFSAVLGCTGL